jgi:prevent-host-death family protein
VQARNELGQFVNHVRHDHEAIVISDYGTPVATLTPADELDRLREDAEIADTDARKAAGGPVMTHEAFMAELEAEDKQAAES